MNRALILENVKKYEMDGDQAMSLWISSLWEDLTAKILPGYEAMKLKRSGDPRKSLLFKYCYKLYRETKGILDENDYDKYIIAQLTILKNIKFGDTQSLVAPQCLVGIKAWRRWKMWRYRYDKEVAKPREGDLVVSDFNTKSEIDKTYDYFVKMYGEITIDKIKNNISDKMLFLWFHQGKISPYYLLLSPWMSSIFEDFSVFGKDLSVFEEYITDEVEMYFSKKFEHEL